MLSSARAPLRRGLAALAAAAALLWVAAACAEEKPPAAPPEPLPQGWTVPIDRAHLLGRLVDGLGNPLRDAEVWVETAADAATAAATLARSDADGWFRAEVAAPATVWASVHAADLPARLVAAGRSLLPGSTVDLGVITLRSYPGLVVQVLAENRTPILGARVQVTPQLSPGNLPAHALAVSTRSQRTDAVGSCRLRALPPGNYVVSVQAAGFRPHERSLVCGTAQQPQRLEVVLEPGLVLTGVIADSRSGAGQRVLVSAMDGGPDQQTTADFSARFRFEDLPAGPHRVGLEANDGSRIWFGPVHPGAAITLPSLPGEPLAGAVSNRKGQPVAGASVTLWPGQPRSPLPSLLLDRLETRTDPAGRFRFDAVPPGRYELVTSSEGYVPTRIPLPSVTTEPMLLELALAEPLLGRVLDARGLPLQGASVECLPLDNLGPLAGYLPVVERHRTASGADGRFGFPGLASGAYALRATAPGMGPGLSGPVVVGGDQQPAAIELRLSPAAYCVGSLRHGGELVRSGKVTALPRQPGDAGATALVAADGSFRLGPLAAGEHILVYSSPGPEGGGAVAPLEQRTQVVLAAGEQRRLELTLP